MHLSNLKIKVADLIGRMHLRDMSIRRKLLAITFVIILVLSSVSLLGFQMVNNRYNEVIYTRTAESLSAISDKVTSRLNNLMENSLNIAVNNEFQANVAVLNARPSDSAHGNAWTRITELLYRSFQSDIITISVFPLTETPIVLGFDSSAEEDDVFARATKLAAKAEGAPVWVPSGRDDSSILLVRQIHSIENPFLRPLGFLVFRVDLDKIVRSCINEMLTGQYDIAISQTSEHLYPHLNEDETSLDLMFTGEDKGYTVTRYNGEISFLTRSHIRATNLLWNFTLSIPYGEIYRSLVTANTLFITCIAVSIPLLLLLSRYLLRGINQNVALLTAKMERVRRGDLERYNNPAPLDQDELGTLNHHFDQMTADFKQVIEDNYVKQLLLSQTQLKALEQQINPHFLYNSLESINWFARSGDGEHVSAIAQSLGRLLRSTLAQDNDCIPLKQELDTLHSYVSIQRIRFPDTLRMHTYVDEAAFDLLVPKMSIQPLIENAIIHGLEENIGECHIELRVSLQGDTLLVQVSNDGNEIDVDILQKLRNHEVQPKGNGIGLNNIDTRIKLLFGEAYGISLCNLPERVQVSFTLPATAEPPHPKIPPQTPPTLQQHEKPERQEH